VVCQSFTHQMKGLAARQQLGNKKIEKIKKKKNRKKKSFENRYNFAARGGMAKIDTPYDSPLWAILKTENHLVLRPVV
jgi:hypothetical protein